MLMDLRREREPGCLSDLAFDEWQSGEVSAEQASAFESHVAGCPICTARRRELTVVAESFLAAAPAWRAPSPSPRHAGKRANAPAPSRRKGVLIGSGAALLAAAAALVLLLRPLDDSGTRSKGGGESLGFFVKHGERVRPGMDRERVHPGDVLRFTVSMHRSKYVAVFGFDARRGVSVYYPPAPTAPPLGPGQSVPLDVGVELDDTQGEERIIALFCDAPANLKNIQTELQRTGTIAPRPGCSTDVLRLEKDTAP
jgi:hypothetical protein